MKKKLTTTAKEPIRIRFKELSNGNKSIYLDIYINGKRQREFLKLYLIPENTRADKTQNEETLRTANAIKAQRVIALQNEEHGFTVSNKAKVNFIAYMQAQKEIYVKRGDVSFATTVDAVIKHIRKYKGDNIMLKQVDKTYILGFIDYLDTVISKHKKPLAKSTKVLYFRILTALLNKAVKDDILPINPIDKIDSRDKPKAGDATKVYLTLDELKSLATVPCKNNQIKRAFLFACFCGLRLSDVRELEWDKIHKIRKGEYQIEIQQKKTEKPVYLPLSSNAMKWLPERGQARDTDVIFTLPTVATVEKHLKKWAQEAGIKKHVTFHVSRHTIATLSLSYGGDINAIKTVLGHANLSTTQIYAKITDDTKRKAVEAIPEI